MDPVNEAQLIEALGLDEVSASRIGDGKILDALRRIKDLLGSLNLDLGELLGLARQAADLFSNFSIEKLFAFVAALQAAIAKSEANAAAAT